jgi:hypothetical protein
MEAKNSVLWKVGTREGPGSQWGNRLASISHEDGSRKGL